MDKQKFPGDRIQGKRKVDPVCLTAWILAAASAFFVHPDRGYRDYIDWRSLGILWSLMIVIQGLKENGIFDKIGEGLIKRMKRGWQLAAVLIFLCFFLSMLITNDVALITFVPFAIMILEGCGLKKMILPVVVLQTVAANLGSMLTPIGNPQNLYLYGLTGMSIGEFVSRMFPYTSASAGMLAIMVCFLPQREEDVSLQKNKKEAEKSPKDKKSQDNGAQADGTKAGDEANKSPKQVAVFSLLFLAALLTVLRLIPWYGLAVAVLCVTFVINRRILIKADYVLLFTFVGFFLFTGNIGRISWIGGELQKLVGGREVIVSVLTSQCISNVPATLLLAGFTSDYPALLTGVNLGGLGTLIASMASLISYKAFSGAYPGRKGSYLAYFTAVNVGFLAVLLCLYRLIH